MVPTQPLADGVTAMTAVVVADELLPAENDAMFPEPVEERPMPVLLFVHVYVAPGTVPEKLTPVVEVPLQSVWLSGCVTLGGGLTVTVKVLDVPTQLLAAGVTVTIAVAAMVPEFTAVKDAILPDPVDASPIPVLPLVQVYVVPETAPE